ncbi:hypothetical protein SeKB_A4363, partial [Salmonella enterica subsp. enterica serovar Kentucky str. CDC 191]
NSRSFPGSSHSANDLSGIKAGPEFKKKNSRALRKRFRYNVAAK